ncbi:DHA2 family efflux MFS transporter permease subunit [Aquabacter sp. CN5-332]|uniref:DHA2 family efflux MFS transporter permease subunit n=1 Tax=Aquabacter sp. CN5-332 TaxID=3156608 RepID=UPI0032B37D80
MPAARAQALVERQFCPVESRKFVLIAAILASAMGFIDTTVVALATPAIRVDLGASLVDAQWISNSYMLFLSALVLLGGAAGDVFGARNTFAFGIAVFAVSSLACAAAPDALSLILVRAAQGFGAAFMVPGSLAVIARAYPPEERGAAIGIWAAASSLTTAVGPLIGGLVLSFDSSWAWRSIFALNIPIGALALVILLRRVPSDARRDRQRLDLVGAVLVTVALGALAWGLTASGPAGGPDLLAWLSLGGGALIFAIFIRWELRVKAPLVKIGLFSSRAFAGANLYTLAVFIALNALLFFLPMTVISAWNVPEWQASLLLLPLALAIGVLSGTAGRLADRIGPRLPMTIGAAIVGVAFAGVALSMPYREFWILTLPLLSVMGLGMAALVSPLSTAALAAAPEVDSGLASGINNAVARAGGLIAVAALGAVASAAYIRSSASAGVSGDFGVRPIVALEPLAEATRVAATTVAFQWIAAICAALCFAAAALAWMTQPQR